jgi:hypothetical protein
MNLLPQLQIFKEFNVLVMFCCPQRFLSIDSANWQLWSKVFPAIDDF